MSVAIPLPRTTVGSKVVVALTGTGLLGFVIFHMLGNLQIFLGPDAINSYAHFLKSKPALLWTGRLGLLALFVLHVAVALNLRRRNAAARPIRYVYEHTEEASWASRSMVLTGLVILAFLLYHLAHFTLGWTNPDHFHLRDALDRHDVYGMTVRGFQNPLISGLYVVAQVFLFLHLSHGAASILQTLGLNGPQYDTRIRLLGWVVALVILLGNVSMPLAVLVGIVQ